MYKTLLFAWLTPDLGGAEDHPLPLLRLMSCPLYRQHESEPLCLFSLMGDLSPQQEDDEAIGLPSD